MNVLKRLWKSVQKFSYPVDGLDARPAWENRKSTLRNAYAAALLEQMESRLLMTTWTGGTHSYTDAEGKAITIKLSSDVTVQAYFASDSNGDGKLELYNYEAGAERDLYCLIVTSSTVNSSIIIYGDDIYSNSVSSLWTGSDADNLPITAPTDTGEVYIGYHTTEGTVTNVPTSATIIDSSTDSGIVSEIVDTGIISSSTDTLYAGIYVTADSHGDAQSVGKIMVDGTVTGKVNISGSVGTFYCGWLLTGDTSLNSTFVNDNFYVGGNLGTLLVNTSVGTNETSSVNLDDYYYNTQVDIHVAGQIGNIQVGGVFVGTVTADNSASAPSLSDEGWTQTETTQWIKSDTDALRMAAFSSGYIPILSSSPLVNSSTSTATYIGSVSGESTATVSGTLQYATGYSNNLDYYAVGLTAKQTISVTVSGNSGVYWGVVNAEGTVVAISDSDGTLTYTATDAGIYYIVIATAKDSKLNGSTSTRGVYNYTLNVSGLGSQAIGGMNIAGDLVINYNGDGIVATRGNIGAIVSGGTIYAENSSWAYSSGNYAYLTTNSITVANGNIGAIVGSSIGALSTANTVVYGLGISVSGTFGLLQATGDFLGAYIVAGNDIQTLDSAGELAGKYYTKRAIGVIRAQQMTLGTIETQFSADYDNSGNDGIIDLIEVSGNFGSLQYGGPRITTGTGGNVRFIVISDTSSIFQDSYYSSGSTANDGGIAYHGGESIQYVDDSGAIITLSPATTDTSDSATTSMIVWTYGIYGTGGVVIIRVESTYSLTVTTSSSSSNSSQSAEIGTIVLEASGAALISGTNGTYVNPTTVSADETLNTLSISGNFRLDVYSITNSGSGVINSITNNTSGDIVNINADDIGTISVRGNLGLTSSATGATLNQIAVIADTYPFVNQHNGIVAGNIGSISAGKAIGAVVASGSINTIVANSDDVNDTTTFEGINGCIVVSGSVNSIEIGEGIAANGIGSYSSAGIYVGGTLYSVTGTDADIRGDIISKTSINSITLNNGSLIGAMVAVFTDFDMAWRFNQSTQTPESASDTTKSPIYEIGKITINGEGGIIGCSFIAADIGIITVGSSGFGVIDSSFMTLADGVLGGISAGGLGLVGIYFSGYRIGYLTATGNGSVADLDDYSDSVRLSESYTVNPYTGQTITNENPNLVTGYYTDLTLYLSDLAAYYGYTEFYTGMILVSDLQGSYGLGAVSAYGIENSTFEFANSIASISVKSDITNTIIQTGTISSLNIEKDAVGLDLEVAGAIGTVTVKGDLDSNSLIYAKGSSSSINSLTVYGDFDGTLLAQGPVKNLVIGTASKTSAGAGIFDGTITLLGDTAAGNITFYGTVSSSALLTIDGDISGTMTFSQGMDGSLVVSGNVNKIVIGTDTYNNNGLTGDITIDGDLKTFALTGAMASTSTMIIAGDLGSFTISGTDATLLAGSLTVGGSATSITINGSATTTGGSLTGYIQVAKSIGTLTVNNGDIASGAVIKTILGSISNMVVNNGIIDGTIISAGSIGAITLTKPGKSAVARTYGSIGSNASISATSLTALTVPGSIQTGADITLSGALGTLTVTGDIADNASITATAITKAFTVTGNMYGDLSLTQTGVTNTLNITGNFGSDSTTATLTVAGSLILKLTGNFAGTSTLLVGGDLASLTMTKGALNGTIMVNGSITTISAASMGGAVITAGASIGKITLTGVMSNSLIQSGLTRGSDGTLATGATCMGSIGTISSASITNSVIAAGGAIQSVTSKGIMSGSSISSGLVFDASDIQNVINDTSRLADSTEIAALRAGGTLYHGDVTTVSVNGGKAGGLISSAITAGVSAGDDGLFGTTDDKVGTVGTSKFKSIKALSDSGDDSVILAETGSSKSINGSDIAGITSYTLSPSGTLISPTSQKGNTYTYTIDGQTITITVSSGMTVQVYDDNSGDGVLDTLVISGSSATAGSVTIVAANPDKLSIGQVLTTDDTNLGTFVFNGDIVGTGDASSPSLLIDSAMKTFTVRSLATNANWVGTIGGDVTTLTIGTQGTGSLTIAGAVKTLKITSSNGAGTTGIVANSFGTITLGSTLSGATSYTGRIQALIGGTTNSISSVIVVGSPAFAGEIVSAGSIGTVTLTNAAFNGTLTVGGNAKTITIAKAGMGSTGDITVSGVLTTLSIGGDLAGTLSATMLNTLAVKGDIAIGASVSVSTLISALTVSGGMSGTIDAGAATKIAITGITDGDINVEGDVASLALSGGTDSGSMVMVDGTIASLNVGGTHAGTIATGIGGNVTKAVFKNVDSGMLVVAGDLTSLTVTGDATDALFSAGVWIGSDGLYNSSDDVVYGGNIGSASFVGTYKDSVLAAGVLPDYTGTTGIPTDHRDYTGNSSATSIADVNPAETGGITRSTIGKITFSKKVVSSNTNTGVISIVVTADEIADFNYKGTLTSAVIGNPSEQLEVESATLVDSDTLEVVFNQDLDTSTINDTTVAVYDSTNTAYSGLTYSYGTRVGSDGLTEYVLTITLASGLSDAATVSLTGGTSGSVLTNHVGLRSAKILDLNNDGSADYQPFTSVSVTVATA